MVSKHEGPKKGIIEKGFDLDRRLNVAIGLGATAVAFALPPVAVPAAIVAGGSFAAIPISDRLRSSVTGNKKK